MPFYVFVDPPTQRAVVHRGDCGHCKEGRGQKGAGPKYETSEWLGPFVTAAAAFRTARASHMTIVKECGHCEPAIRRK